VAQGQAHDGSDLDLHVDADEDNACRNVNRLLVGGRPFGGRPALRDVRCDCPVCRDDLAALESVAEKDNGAHRFPDAPRSGDIAWTR
jgi:hypothetical protein